MSDPSLWDQPERLPPHQRHSDTSRAAARKVIKRVGPLHCRIIEEMLRRKPEWGATDHELQSVLDLNPSTERPRRIELRNAGIMYSDDKTKRDTPSGCKAFVWYLRRWESLVRRFPRPEPNQGQSPKPGAGGGA